MKAEIGGKFNYNTIEDIKKSRSNNSGYIVYGNFSYDIGRYWSARTSLSYRSKIIRTYTTTTDYVGCDIRIDKKLGKRHRFRLFWEVKDLFDKDIKTVLISSDKRNVRLQVDDNNRRLFALGMNFKF